MASNVIIEAASAPPQIETGIASELLSPGELVERGGSDDFQPHSTAAGDTLKMFALAQTANEGAGIDDDIAAGDELDVVVAKQGDKVQAIAGMAISEGDLVESDGAGRLNVLGTTAAAGTNIVVGEALEAAAADGDRITIQIA